MIPLGSEVQDTVTGFKGITCSEHRYLTGCLRYGVQPKVRKDGSLPAVEMMDEPFLKVLKRAKAKPADVTGGPRSNPARPLAPTRR